MTTGIKMNKRKQAKVEKAIDKMLDKQYNPGSLEASDHGCTCPIMDNEYGKGYMGMKDVYVYNGDCPMHGINGTQKKKGAWKQ